MNGRYDLTPTTPRIRFVEYGAGPVHLMGYVVVPVFIRTYAADKAARALIATLKG